MSRYVVTEIEGHLTPISGPMLFGLSCHVIDTVWNHRMVATFRTEDMRYRGRTYDYKRILVREQSRRLADELNRAAELQAA